MKSWLLLPALVIVVGCESHPADLSGTKVASIVAAKSITIYAIDPAEVEGAPAPAEKIGGYGVRGKATIEDPALLRTIATAVLDSLEHDGVSPAKCFLPRHAIVAGEDTFLICFECRWLHLNDEPLVIDDDAQSILSQIWSDHSLSIAP